MKVLETFDKESGAATGPDRGYWEYLEIELSAVTNAWSLSRRQRALIWDWHL